MLFAWPQRVHLSNYDINAREDNMYNYLADKPEVSCKTVVLFYSRYSRPYTSMPACHVHPHRQKVGKGSIWTTELFEGWLRANRPDISIDGMWRQVGILGLDRQCDFEICADIRVTFAWVLFIYYRQLRLIGRKAAQSIAAHRSVRQHATPPHLQHELFGLDVMLDAGGKAWLLEANNSPGLEYCSSHFPDGAEDPTAAASDAVTW